MYVYGTQRLFITRLVCTDSYLGHVAAVEYLFFSHHTSLGERAVNVPAMSQNKRTIKRSESIEDKMATLSQTGPQNRGIRTR